MLERTKQLTRSNVLQATEWLMLKSHLKLVEIFERNNLQNHVGEIHSELTHGGFGFRIWTDDWVIFFNEFGTGIFNANGVSTNHPWVYYKDNSFHTTIGQRPKAMFGQLQNEIIRVMGDEYNSCIHLAFNQEQYNGFKSSLRG